MTGAEGYERLESQANQQRWGISSPWQELKKLHQGRQGLDVAGIEHCELR